MYKKQDVNSMMSWSTNEINKFVDHDVVEFLSCIIYIYIHTEFNNEYFIQTRGTAVGTKLAPGYLILLSIFIFIIIIYLLLLSVFLLLLLLSIFERYLLSQYPIKPSIPLRYIDDMFMVWNESEDKLKGFLTYINTVIPAI